MIFWTVEDANMHSELRSRAPRNKTIALTQQDQLTLAPRLLRLCEPTDLAAVLDRTICQDALQVIDHLPSFSVDLLFADPPYNLNKTFNQSSFARMDVQEYESWLDGWVSKIVRVLKPTASVYICGDWRSSGAIHRIAERYFQVRNRITWEREKGRGASMNWKNASEDIWFCTKSDDFKFRVDRVKIKRRVIAPYSDSAGRPKDWSDGADGKYRLTHPSNLWTDLTVPFWSMPENTDHPTQKPEKLLAKVILASSDEGDVVFDPFLGSGTTSVVAKKLNRRFIGIEIDSDYCCLAEKRLALASQDSTIQGYTDSVFWERNTLTDQRAVSARPDPVLATGLPLLFRA
jgi:site-specific DNA-methyltransferase (adenine-specific)